MPIIVNTKSQNRCSYCHKLGHNKTTCPTYKARIEEWREEYGDEHPWVAAYDRKKAKKRSPRRCSYCSEQGHTRRTCSTLKEHMAITKEQNKVYRKMFLEAMHRSEVSVGAMVLLNPYRDVSENLIITKINWEDISFWHDKSFYLDHPIVKTAKGFDFSQYYAAKFLARKMNVLFSDNKAFRDKMLGFFADETLFEEAGMHWYRGDEYSYEKFVNSRECFRVVSPTGIKAVPPEGWLECEDGSVEEAYTKRKCSYGYLKRPNVS